jgi:hypothetical protein
MGAHLLQIERCVIDPGHPDVLAELHRTSQRLGYRASPPRWAQRVWRHVLTTDVDDRPLGVETSWAISLGSTPNPPNMRSDSHE